ncbi:MAG: TonB-dependent receptor [Azospirillaceae bacterium]|nr:TonB-dependent receptor [Azospirillaceae bacterium]
MRSLLLGVSALVLGCPAFAQSANAPQATGGVAAPQGADAPAGSAPLEEVVVTGSRVIKDGSASPTPLTTVDTAALFAAAPSGSISDALNNLPVFSGSRNSFSNPGSNATGVQGGNGSANVLNLRNLGSYRTLVLFDGHRVPPTLYNSTVDVDIIPQELIQRVDIVTGGVSAVYGSDAVSGVVNYVLNRKFDGYQAHSEFGISDRGDARNRDVGGAFGFEVGSNGHFEASVQHRESDGILNRAGDRDWDNLAAMQGAGTAANPYVLDTNVRLRTYSFGGLITSGALNGQTFNSNGVLSTFNKGTSTGSTCCQIGGDGAYQNASMISPYEGTQLFARYDLDISDHVHAFIQGGANLKTNTSYTGWNQLSGLTLSATNAFLPAAYQNAFAAAGQKTFTMNEIWSGAPRIEAKTDTTQLYLNTGLEGDFSGFDWNTTYTHGSSRMKTTVSNLPNAERLSAALDAVVDPSTGNIVCQASLTNPSKYGSCVPLNLFGPTAASSKAINYVLGGVGFLTHTDMDAVDASISRTAFDDWAGPVNVALSGEWRRETFDASSTATASDYADCTGLRYNCTSTTTLYPSTFPNSDTVAQSVKEVALEVEVPLLKDLPFAKSLDLNAAARFTDYSTSGQYLTWKVGSVWQVDSDLKFRGTVSRDIRAPTLYDLFQPKTVVPGNFTDTLTNTTSYVPSINTGNTALQSEVGHTYTGGFVYEPSYIPGATFTVDYYHTEIDNAITTVQGFNAATQAACYASNGTSPYCSLIQRDASGAVTAYYIQPQNIATVKTWGIDAEVGYNTELFDRGLGLRFLVNWQPHIYYAQPGVALIDQGDAGWGQNGLMPSPSVQLAAFASYQVTDQFKVDLFEHYRNGFRRSGVASQVYADEYVGSYATTNVTLTYDVGSMWKVKESSIYFSVTNVFDATPPLSGYYSGTTSAGQAYEFSDDPTGRAFLIGFRIKG